MFSSNILSKAFRFSLLGVGLALTAQQASAQTIYSTDFESGFAYNQEFSDQNGWSTNDQYTGGTYQGADIGNSDSVGYINGFSTTGTDHAAYLGGALAPAFAYPGNSTVYAGHGINSGAATAYQVNTDFTVTPSSGAVFTGRDSFGFTFRNGSNSGATPPVNLFSINFTPKVGDTTRDDISVTSGATTGASPYNFQLGLRYHLTVNVSVGTSTFSASFYAEDASGNQTGSTFVITPSTAYTGTISDIAATWNLANTNLLTQTAPADNLLTAGTNNRAYTQPGSGGLTFDNLVVAVPEPSTYALLGLGAFGLAVAARRGRRAQVA